MRLFRKIAAILVLLASPFLFLAVLILALFGTDHQDYFASDEGWEKEQTKP